MSANDSKKALICLDSDRQPSQAMCSLIVNLKRDILRDNGHLRSSLVDLLIIASGGVVVYSVATTYDLLDLMLAFSKLHEDWEIDELLPVAVYLVFGLLFFLVRRWQEIRNSAALLEKNNAELRKALDEINKLRGIIPICANCKNIRDDKGYWHRVELYIQEHSLAEFSHSICPKCFKELYPDLEDTESR